MGNHVTVTITGAQGRLELNVLDGQASEVQVARYKELQELLVSSPATRALEIEARLQREKARRRSR